MSSFQLVCGMFIVLPLAFCLNLSMTPAFKCVNRCHKCEQADKDCVLNAPECTQLQQGSQRHLCKRRKPKEPKDYHSHSNGLTSWEIALLVIGVLLLIAGVVVGIICCICCCSSRTVPLFYPTPPPPISHGPPPPPPPGPPSLPSLGAPPTPPVVLASPPEVVLAPVQPVLAPIPMQQQQASSSTESSSSSQNFGSLKTDPSPRYRYR